MEGGPGVTTGTVEGEEAARHVDTNPGSVEEPVAGVSTEVLRPGEDSALTEGKSEASENTSNSPTDKADMKVESPS